VALMLAMQLAFVPAINHFWGVVTALTLYFVAFNVLEASLPSLVSKIAPARAKGTAMGVYNTSQALGLFVGGAAGGILSQHFGAAAVFEFGAVLIGIWLYLAYGMKAPPAVKNLMFHISALSAEDARRLEQKLKGVMGVAEASVMADEGVAYLKVDSRRFDEQALRRLLPST
jgi:MFS family permease